MTIPSTAPLIVVIQNAPDVPLNLVGKWLAELGFDLRTIHAYAHQPLPSDLDSLQRWIGDAEVLAIIALGGSIGALDDELSPWLVAERALLKDAIDHQLPVLGLCLGAQLLAASNGGAIGRAPRPEIGLHPVTISDTTDPIFGALSNDEPLPTIQWHQDIVATLPPSATAIASSALCRNQIFRIGELQYGLQFHPEADQTIVGMWEKKADEAYQRSEKRSGIADEVASHMERLEDTWRPVIKRWGAMVLDLLATRPTQPTQRQ